MFENLEQGCSQLFNLFLSLILVLLPDKLIISYGVICMAGSNYTAPDC